MSTNTFSTYHTTDGLKVAILDRPALTKYDSQGGKPTSVLFYGDRQQRYTWYQTIDGICAADFEKEQPDLVVYRLKDDSLLSATKEVLLESPKDYSRVWRQDIIKTPVEHLVPLAELPEVAPIAA